MKIKLSDIKSGFKDKFFDIPTNSIPNRGTSFKHKSVHCTLSSLTFQNNRYGLKGYIDTTIGHECVRCLDAFESKIHLPIEINLESNSIKESWDPESENVIKFSNSTDEIDIGVILADFIELENLITFSLSASKDSSMLLLSRQISSGKEIFDSKASRHLTHT